MLQYGQRIIVQEALRDEKKKRKENNYDFCYLLNGTLFDV